MKRKSEIILAAALAIAAAIGVDVLLKSPKANITFELHYEHHGEELAPKVTTSVPGK